MKNEHSENNADLTHISNRVYEIRKIEEIINYLSQKKCKPVSETCIKYIEAGFLATWPEPTSYFVSKNLKEPTTTSKGHKRAKRKNFLPTCKCIPKSESHEITTDPIPVQEKNLH